MSFFYIITDEEQLDLKQETETLMEIPTLEEHVESEDEEHTSTTDEETEVHMGIHQKPFACTECTKIFSKLTNLKSHMRTHSGKKPLSCQECNKRFTQINGLKIHTRTHTGEKPFPCKECNTSFSQISHLYSHMRTHTGENSHLFTETNTLRAFHSVSQTVCVKVS
uniref:C2H2-type domain-containing protein n=1 Tax=Oryzias melastigma TaxID=30732 RepID=A0A3B3D7M0_ORYME